MPAERAGYTVTMFLVDVSPSMGKTRVVDLPDGPKGEKRTREMTNLEWALQFVLLKIQEMIYNGRKTDQCGVILFGTEDTENCINEEGGGYDHVTDFIPIAQPNSGTLAKLQALKPSTVVGDPIDAIIVGIETQDRYLGNKKTWTRKLVMVTDGENPIEVEDWELTTKKMNALDVRTTIVGVDFDDEEFGFQEEDKSHIKRENEQFLSTFVSSLTNGILGTCAFALQECVRPEPKLTKSALMAYVLRLGDVATRPEEAVEVLVKTSKCTAVARPPSMKKFAKRVKVGEAEVDDMDIDFDDSNEVDGEDKKDIYAMLKMRTEYYLDRVDGEGGDGENENDNPEGEGEQQDGEGGEKKTTEAVERVDKEQLIKGFKYGSSYAPCPDGQFPKLTTEKGIDICGFFPDKNLRRDWAMSEVQYIWADPSSGQQQVAFSSIVQAMLERNVVAFARWVTRDGMDPKMGVLVPRSFEKVDCLLWVQMPFADDVRRYTFQSLENLVSKKGEKIEKHAYLPTEEQMSAMDAFVDSMDLMHAGDKDEEGNRMPWFDPRFSFNPAVHRIKQALFHAAVVTDLKTNPLPLPHPEIVKYLEPPRRVLKRAHDATENCKSAFKVQQVPKRVARARKDGHVHAQDDEDEELLLDQFAKRPTTQSVRAPSPTLVESHIKGNGKGKERVDGDVMDVDSTTEPESDGEGAVTQGKKAKKGANALPTPTHSQRSSPDPAESGGASAGSTGREPGRIIGRAHPLEDFEKNIRQGDIVSKAVEDLAWVVKDIVMRPFASRRHEEMVRCMKKLRETCLHEDEIDAWNFFLRDLKASCLAESGISNHEFWEAIQAKGNEMSLISAGEASSLGGQSKISESEAAKFLQT
ncbi:SPOC domain-like protein [Rickenella mellea]|uniref:ATP-dependent DNA helicase II subunit 2 n=1 Tax=Rickenella mellea TaxID=50990 RepID=A0A4Y7PMZ5_9AGAM|nr:SPOC domain-like protein [Rickenella mellea]